MSSDTRFPDLQRSSIWSRLKQFLMLDGGGDWITVDIGAGGTWTCPDGVYEVYVYMPSGNLTLNGHILCIGAAYWMPVYLASTSYVLHSDITGEIGTPGGADTDLDVDGGTVTTVSRYCTCAQGWRLTSGEILLLQAAGHVRYRRVG